MKTDVASTAQLAMKGSNSCAL
jgi:hypothetical protein